MARLTDILAGLTDAEKVDRLLELLAAREQVIDDQEEHINRITGEQERADRAEHNRRHAREVALQYAAAHRASLVNDHARSRMTLIDAAREIEQYLTAPATEEGSAA